jgi:hypothetical protein
MFPEGRTILVHMDHGEAFQLLSLMRSPKTTLFRCAEHGRNAHFESSSVVFNDPR